MTIIQETIRPSENLTGVIPGLPFKRYAEAPGVSKSQLDILHESPEIYRDFLDGKLPRETTEAMEMGRIVHAVALEGRRPYVVRPEEVKNADGKMEKWQSLKTICKNWIKQQTQTVLSPVEANQVEAIARAVRNDPRAKKLLAKGEAELSMFADYDPSGFRLKGRPDWANEDYFVDLKTTTDASTEEFSKEINRRRYHVQASLYLRIAKLLGMPQTKWFFIAVQKSNPPRINVRELNANAIDLGGWQLNDDLALLAECRSTGNWYGFSGKSGEIEEIDCPVSAHERYANRNLNLTSGGRALKFD